MILISCVMNVYPQKIIKDETRNNVRSVMTDDKNFSIRKGSVKYMLCQFSTLEKKEYALVFSYEETEKPNNFPYQSKLFITTKSGKNIVLTCLDSYINFNYPVGMFPISQNDFNLIIEGTKLLEFDLYVMDKYGQIIRTTRKYKKDIGKSLYKMKKKIDNYTTSQVYGIK